MRQFCAARSPEDTTPQAYRLRTKVHSDITAYLDRVRIISSQPAPTVEAGIEVLARLRRETYEDLNQIQHEQMVLCAAEWLMENNCGAGLCWSWNPRQTGNAKEPDLAGTDAAGIVLVSAEITTSEKAAGTILLRMDKTLAKMERMPGNLYYFVRTDHMSAVAQLKASKLRHKVQVVRLGDECFGRTASIAAT